MLLVKSFFWLVYQLSDTDKKLLKFNQTRNHQLKHWVNDSKRRNYFLIIAKIWGEESNTFQILKHWIFNIILIIDTVVEEVLVNLWSNWVELPFYGCFWVLSTPSCNSIKLVGVLTIIFTIDFMFRSAYLCNRKNIPNL